MLDTGGETPVRGALRAQVERLCGLLRPLPDLAAAIPDSRWTVRDVGAHLAANCSLYTEIADGVPSPLDTKVPAEVGRWNEGLIADIPENRPAAMADLLMVAATRFLDRTRGCPAELTVPYHWGLAIPPDALTGILLGEFLLHGLDVAGALRRPWPIEVADALLVLASHAPCYGALVDHRAAAGVTLACEVEIPGLGEFVITFDDGRYALAAASEGPADARLTADPVAWLLVGTGRLSRAAAVATGLFRTSGVRPELGLRLHDLFVRF